MKQKKLLALTHSQLRHMYQHDMPELVCLAEQSNNEQEFRTYLATYIAEHPRKDTEAGKQIQ